MPDPSPDPRTLLPLKPAEFAILMVLVDGEGHGYQIMKEAERRSEGDLRLRPGTLYRILARLLEDGLLEETEERPDPGLDDERRRYYRLSELGRAVTAAEAERLARLVDEARAQDLIRSSRGA